MSNKHLTEDAPTMETKLHSLCLTKGCNGKRLLKKDFGDGKHCSKCLVKLRKEKET